MNFGTDSKHHSLCDSKHHCRIGKTIFCELQSGYFEKIQIGSFLKRCFFIFIITDNLQVSHPPTFFNITNKRSVCIVKKIETRKHSNRMPTDRAVTRTSIERVAMRPTVDRQTPVKTLHSPCGR